MPRLPGCEEDTPPSSGEVHMSITAAALLPKAKNAETEARIDALTAPGMVSEYVTPDDIRKARQGARKAYREDLTNAVKRELSKQPLNIDAMVKLVFDDAVKTVKDKVLAQLGKADVSGALINNEIQKLVRGEFGKNGLPTLQKHIESEVIAFAKEMIAKNVTIKVAEGIW